MRVGHGTDAGRALLERAALWAQRTFPRASDVTRISHMGRELEELRRTPSDGAEMADILLLLVHHASTHNVDLLAELEKKLRINEHRVWGAPDTEGVVEHEEKAPRPALTGSIGIPLTMAEHVLQVCVWASQRTTAPGSAAKLQGIITQLALRITDRKLELRILSADSSSRYRQRRALASALVHGLENGTRA